MVALEWYRSFVTVYRFGTVSGAAQMLGLTQPGVSQHVRALERALRAELFVRAPRRMVPTDEGQRLYLQVADAVDQLESITDVGRPSRIGGSIRVGLPQEFFGEKVLAHFSPDDEDLYLIRFGQSAELLDLLANGQLDWVVATQRATHPGIAYQLLFREQFWLVGAPTLSPPTVTPTSDGMAVLERSLRTHAWIAYGPDLPIIRRFWRQVFKRSLAVTPRLVVPDLRAIRAAVASGLGVSVLPDYLCDGWVHQQRLTVLLAPIPPVTNDLLLAFPKASRTRPRPRLLLDLLH